MLKAVIDKLEDVAEGLRGEYKPLDGGGFALDLDGLGEGTRHPAVGELVRAKKRESESATTKAAEAARLKKDLEKARNDLHDRLKGKVEQSDLEALEASYKQKLAEATTAGQTRESALQGSLREVLVDREARALATSIALDNNAAELLTESLQRRLTVEIGSDGKAVTRVLGVDGKPSALTMDDLKKEIVATPKYHALLLASKARGSGATSGGAGGGAPSRNTVDLATRNPKEYAAEIASRL